MLVAGRVMGLLWTFTAGRSIFFMYISKAWATALAPGGHLILCSPLPKMTLAFGCFDLLQPILGALKSLSCRGWAKLLIGSIMVFSWAPSLLTASVSATRSSSSPNAHTVFYTRSLTSTLAAIKAFPRWMRDSWRCNNSLEGNEHHNGFFCCPRSADVTHAKDKVSPPHHCPFVTCQLPAWKDRFFSYGTSDCKSASANYAQNFGVGKTSIT